MRKKISLLLVFFMLFTMLPMAGFADGEPGYQSEEPGSVEGNGEGVSPEDETDPEAGDETGPGIEEEEEETEEDPENEPALEPEEIEPEEDPEAEPLPEEPEEELEKIEPLALLGEQSAEDIIADQLDAVKAYYQALGNDAPISAPMEGVARFALDLAPSTNALKSATAMEEQYHLKYNSVENLPFEESEISILTETTDGVNAQVWLAQLILDILAAGGDPSDFEGRNYIYELLNTQSESGFFNNFILMSPKASDGAALLALEAYWGSEWPTGGAERGLAISKTKEYSATPTINMMNTSFADEIPAFSTAQWGLSNTMGDITFYNNFWLTQGLSIEASETESNIASLANGLNKITAQARCETWSAHIIARLTAGSTVEASDWQYLKSFQMENGQYKRGKSDAVANGEATAMAAIALDYGSRLAVDDNAQSAFLRLQEANIDVDRSSSKTEIENAFEAVKTLKNKLEESGISLEEILDLVSEEGYQIASSNEDLVSNEGTMHPLEAGEPDVLVQLKIIVENGTAVSVVPTKEFKMEPSDKTFPFEKNMQLLKDYYKNYPKGEMTKGLNMSLQAFAVASLFDDPSLDGIPYHTKFYGDGGYASSRPIINDSESAAVIDYVALNLDPRQYIRHNLNTGNEDLVDLIESLLSRQYSTGSFIRDDETYSPDADIYYTLALEAYFGGRDWGNESADTKLGRIGSIESLLSHMKDASESEWATIGEDEARMFHEVHTTQTTKKGSRFYENNIQSLAAILFSRWLEDETLVTVHGETKPLKEFARAEVDGLLQTLKWIYDQEGLSHGKKLYNTEGHAYYISAMIAGGHRDKVDVYKLWDKLRNARTDEGTYFITAEYNTSTLPEASTAMAMAMGDYAHNRSILGTMVYDVSALTDEEALAKDIRNLQLPTIARDNLLLPSEGYYGSTITWTSSNPDVIDPQTGHVSRPQDMNALVVLTAALQRGEASETKQFNITVPALSLAGYDEGNADYDALVLPLFVTEKMTLPITGKHGSTIQWESLNPSVLSNTGAVNQGAQDTKVTLKATITNGSFVKIKEFNITVGKAASTDNLDKAIQQLRAYYNDNRSLTVSYWDVFAARSVLGDSFADYDFKVYDVDGHRTTSAWQGTDYGAVVLQILAQGDNPYNYQGQNHVKKLQEFVSSKGWGAYGAPIWAAMALDAAGADPTGYSYNRSNVEGFLRGQLREEMMNFGPDLAGWSLVPMATTMERNGTSTKTQELEDFAAFIKSKQTNAAANRGLVIIGGGDGISATMSNACLVNGFSAMKGIGVEGFDLNSAEWKKSNIGILDALYTKEVKDGEKVNPQIAIAMGDAYYGDSVWRRVGVKPEQLANTIQQAEAIVTNGADAYTTESLHILTEAYQAAFAVQNDTNKMKNYYFGASYFALKEAVEGLREKGTAEITIYGKADNKILDKASIRKVGNVLEVLQEATMTNGISFTGKEGTIEELGGIKTDTKGQWYVYEQMADGDFRRITEPLNAYQVAEGTTLVAKYWTDAAQLPANASLNQHFVHEAARTLTIGGAINSSQEATGDVELLSSGMFGTTISWFSSKPFAIDEKGKVVRDANEDISVVLTARIYLNGINTEKQFTIKVKSLGGGSGAPTDKVAYISITGPVGESWSGSLAKQAIQIEAGETAFSLLEKTGANLDVDYSTQYGVYVRGINGLSEFDRGAQSGWMYRINGGFPGRSAALERVYENDYVEWMYTKDLGKDVGNIWSGDSTGGSGADQTVTPETTIKDGKGTTDLSLTAMKDVIANAKTNNADIIIEPKTTGDVKAMDVTLKNDALQAIVKETTADVIVKTPVGDITIPAQALEAIAAQAGGNDITIQVKNKDVATLTQAQKEKVEDKPVYDISITSGGKNISSFDGKNITVSLPYTLKAGEKASDVKVWYLNDKGQLEEMKCTYDEKTGLATFATNHLSKFMVGVETASDKPVVTLNFTDVSATDWFYDAVKFAVENGLFKGTSESTFSPNEAMTRGMLVSVLHRMAGEPAGYKSSFTDVNENDWFAGPVAWAAANNVVSGYGQGLFGPNDKVTREQIAAILHRYAQSKGYELTKTKDLSAYKDAGAISPWAKEVLAWANAEGLINGRSADLLAPGESATRAEVAAILQRFIENVMK